MALRFSVRMTVALLLLSAGALCFEVALLRLYAIQQFYHFAFLVIGLAVLGTAAGGVALALAARPAPPAALACGFSLAICLAYAVLNLTPFDSYAIAWDRRQVGVLGLYFGSAALPFFFAGWFTGSVLTSAGPSAGRAYAASLIGSALGPPLALATGQASRLEAALAVAAASGLLSAALLTTRRVPRFAATAGIAVLLAIAARPPEITNLRLSPNKPLAQARLAPGARVAGFEEGLSARLEVVEGAPVHSFPGISLRYLEPLPSQLGFYLDGDGPLAVTWIDPDGAAARELAHAMPGGVACRLRPGGDVLLLRSGAGLEAALALACGAASVTIPVDEPVVSAALLADFADTTYGLLSHPRLRLDPASSRLALEAGDDRFDVVAFALTDPFRPVASGAFSLSETYDLTLESFVAALHRLNEGGLLVVHRWLTTPPAESLRAWATLLQALRQTGVDPTDRVVAFRSLRTSTVVASLRPFDPSQLRTIRVFLERNGYDPIYLPDLQPGESNRFLHIPQDPYPGLFHSLLNDPAALTEEYPFRIEPATDDRPFFFHYFRWEQTPSAIAALGQTWQPFGGSGYLVLLALLLLMLLLAAALLLPAALARQTRGRLPARAWIYFAGIGFGFLLVELTLLQRFTLPLERPPIAFVFVVGLLLLSSGVGSRVSETWPARRLLLVLAGLIFLLALALPGLIRPTLAWSYPARLAWTGLVIAPLGLLMGAPFPAGLRRFAAASPAAVGLVWAVNGAASGIAGVLAALSALDLGLSATLGLGGAAYLTAWLAFDRGLTPRG